MQNCADTIVAQHCNHIPVHVVAKLICESGVEAIISPSTEFTLHRNNHLLDGLPRYGVSVFYYRFNCASSGMPMINGKGASSHTVPVHNSAFPSKEIRAGMPTERSAAI